jgi:hypothetical protein
MTDNIQNETEAVKTFGNPPVPVADVVDADGNTYCQVHTDRETGLRCNNCGRLMCAQCAVSTPVGYRCEQCVRQREAGFFNADTTYYVKLVAVTTVLGAVGAFVANLIGFFLFVFFIAAFAGGIISEAAMRVTKGQRGRYTAQAAAAGVVAGAVIALLLTALPYLSMVSSASLTPEQVTQLVQQFGEQQAAEIVQQIRQEQSGLVMQILGASLFNLSVWIYAGITAATVYGRFNIYGGRRR